MARPRRINPTLVAQAQKVVATATDLHQLRAAQAILLPAWFGASLEKTAALLGVGRSTVHRLQARFGAPITAKPMPRKPWGGRRHALLTVAEEKKFVSHWQAKAEAGELVVLSMMRADLEKQLGRKVAPEVFYRLVRRHRWRKVAPDTRHPKSDPVVQEEWKKNAPGVAGGRVETGASAPTTGTIVFSGRGPVWPDGPISSLLGSQPPAPQSLQWLRARIYLCVWIGQSAGRASGLESQFEDEHPPNEGVSGSSQRRACRGIHPHDCGRRQFAQKQRFGSAGESPLDPFARLLPGTKPPGACLG